MAFAAGPLLPVGQADAQTPSPSQIPPGERAGQGGAAATITLPPPQGQRAPANADTTVFTLRDLDVEGGFAGVSAPAPETGSQVTVGALYRYAEQLQQAYLDAGYPLVRVIVPAQNIDASGQFRIRVISGVIRDIDVSAVPERVRNRVRSVLAPLAGQANPTRGEIERRLLLAGDTAGVTLRSALSPGQATGETALVVSGSHKLVEGALSFDNGLGEDMGRYQATASTSINSLFGARERFVVTLAGPADDTLFEDNRAREYIGLLGEIPLGNDGLMLSVDGAYARSRPQGAVAAQKLESEYSRAGLTLSYPWMRTRNSTHRWSVSLERAEERQTTGIVSPSATLSLDSVTVLRAGLTGQMQFPDAAAIGYDARISTGIDALGARTSEDASPLKPLSRAGADATFTKLNLATSLFTPLALGVNFTGSAMLASGLGEPLLRSEQTSIIGTGLVSGPPPGSLVGDDAVAGRAELERPIRSGLGTLVPYAFGSAGKVYLSNPTALETATDAATSVGIGLRTVTSLPNSSQIVGRLEWSLVETRRQDLDRYWLTGSLALRF